jgi:hypothetical protein
MTNEHSSHPTNTKWVKLMAVAALMVAFVSGGTLTGLVARWYYRTHPVQSATAGLGTRDGKRGPNGPEWGARGGRGGGPDGGPTSFLAHFKSELQLSDDQVKQIEGILEQSREQMTQFRNETRPRFMAIREQTETQMRAILNPEQQKKFDEMTKREDRDRRQDRGDREGPPRPH